MTTLTRSQLLPFFDLRREINFSHHAQTEIVRAYDATDQAALVEKKYSGTLSNLQIRENALLFAVSQHEVDGVQLTARIAALRNYKKKDSVQGIHEILVKWYGFDLEDWYTLLSGTPGNPFHQARFLLELVRSALKALHLLHAAGFVHADVHNGNWCLPFTGAALEPDGSALRCTLDPDALKLIDLGLSLKPAEERGLPPRLYSAAGGVGEVITLNDRATPAHPRRLVDALDRARLGDLAPWKALDWRLDMWRLGALIDLWRDAAGEAEGLTGAKPLRVLLADLADALKRPEQQALAGAAPLTKLPHGNWVEAITAAIGQPQPLAVSLPLQPAEARALVALATDLPSPMPSPVPSPAPVPAPVPTPGRPRRAWRAVPLVMALGLGLAGAWWWTARPKPVEPEQATPSSPPQLAVIAPAGAPAVAGQPSARSEAYPAGPVMVNLPQIAGNATGTLLGQADGGEGDEKPLYRVRMPYQLAMGETAVTFTQWDLCVSEGGCQQKPSDNGWGRGERPVINVNWHDAQEYLLWLNRKAGLDPKAADRYRLPTEAERELAARAGNDGEFSLGPNNDKRLGPQTANFNATKEYRGSATGEYRQKTVPVKERPFQPNAWGLWHMHGNVWEWVQDCSEPNEYQRREKAAGGWLASQSSEEKADCRRVLRGGSWDDNPQNLRSANRDGSPAGFRYYVIGFRLARTLP